MKRKIVPSEFLRLRGNFSEEFCNAYDAMYDILEHNNFYTLFGVRDMIPYDNIRKHMDVLFGTLELDHASLHESSEETYKYQPTDFYKRVDLILTKGQRATFTNSPLYAFCGVGYSEVLNSKNLYKVSIIFFDSIEATLHSSFDESRKTFIIRNVQKITNSAIRKELFKYTKLLEFYNEKVVPCKYKSVGDSIKDSTFLGIKKLSNIHRLKNVLYITIKSREDMSIVISSLLFAGFESKVNLIDDQVLRISIDLNKPIFPLETMYKDGKSIGTFGDKIKTALDPTISTTEPINSNLLKTIERLDKNPSKATKALKELMVEEKDANSVFNKHINIILGIKSEIEDNKILALDLTRQIKNLQAKLQSVTDVIESKKENLAKAEYNYLQEMKELL